MSLCILNTIIYSTDLTSAIIRLKFFKINYKVHMDGGNKSDALDLVSESHMLNDEMINGTPEKAPNHRDSIKRLILVFLGLFVVSILLVIFYVALFKSEPAKPAPAAEPKPTTVSVKIEGDKELESLSYGTDYIVSVSGSNYLVNVLKSPKRVIYNGKEVYRGEDLARSALSENGKYWAIETIRDEVRSKRDENTKIVQDTTVRVSTLTINGQKWGEKDNSSLLKVTDNGAPVILSKTGKQTPSQYGEALGEQVIYIGADEKFKTSYGVVSFDMSGDGSNWLATTTSPSTKESVDLFVNNVKKESLDTRILKRVDIDSEGNYLLGFCQQSSEATGVGILGKDCQISINSKTRTTVSGSVYIAGTLGKGGVYAGVDRELKQGFIKNNRSDLALEHRKDLDGETTTPLGVYLNQAGDKYAVTTSRKIEGKLKVNLSINGEVIDNTISSDSLFGFGPGDDAATLFIYELPASSSVSS